MAILLSCAFDVWHFCFGELYRLLCVNILESLQWLLELLLETEQGKIKKQTSQLLKCDCRGTNQFFSNLKSKWDLIWRRKYLKGFLLYLKILPGTFSRYIKTLNPFHFSFKIRKVIFDAILHLIRRIGIWSWGWEVALIYRYKKDTEELVILWS